MTEADARAAVEQIVGTGAIEPLERFKTLLLVENERQNLIAGSTIPVIWQRHFLDSAQLLQWKEGDDGRWIDIGTGGGFPGMVMAIAHRSPITLVEPRRHRAAFLSRVINELQLEHATVVANRIERMPAMRATIISARAVASIDTLFADAYGHADVATTWLLPRGAGWSDDIEDAKKRWKAVFHVEQSLSDPNAKVVIATKVCRR